MYASAHLQCARFHVLFYCAEFDNSRMFCRVCCDDVNTYFQKYRLSQVRVSSSLAANMPRFHVDTLLNGKLRLARSVRMRGTSS